MSFGICSFRLLEEILTDFLFLFPRFPHQLAGQKGDALAKRVWNETLEELAFADVEGILSSLKDKEMTTGKNKGDYLR